MSGPRGGEQAARLRVARAYAGLQAQEMARALGISTRTLARRESGDDPVTPGEIALAIQATGVPKAFMDSGWAALSGSDSNAAADRLAEVEEAQRVLSARLAVLEAEARQQTARKGRSSEGPTP